MQGVGSGADSDKDRFENRNSLRAPDRSVVLKIRFFRRRVDVGCIFEGNKAGFWC